VIPKVKSGASDFLSFINKDRPFYAWRTPLIADYHQPSDESWKADIGKATRIIKLGFLDAWDFVNQ